MPPVSVCHSSELREGEPRIVTVADREVALFLLDGQPYAIDNACPHRAGPLGAGDLVAGVIHCPLHAWSFNVRTGESTSHPGVRVQTHRAELSAQGQVCVTLSDPRRNPPSL